MAVDTMSVILTNFLCPRLQVFYATFLHSLETGIKSNAFMKTLKQLMQRHQQHPFYGRACAVLLPVSFRLKKYLLSEKGNASRGDF